MNKKRLITRSDFDGLVCAVLLKHLNLVNDILFVHPKDMQDRKIPVTSNDITTNLPYVPWVYLAFDHHASEKLRNLHKADNYIMDADAPSAARVLYDYYGGSSTFSKNVISDEMMAAVDKADSAQFSYDDIINPQGWTLLSFLMDSRTGLGRFRDFTISNYSLMMKLIDDCASRKIEDILILPDVKERIDLYLSLKKEAKAQLLRCADIYGDVVVLDLRDEDLIYPTNRFMIYALHPRCTVSIHVMWGVKQQNTVLACGKSILNRSSNIDIGALMLEHGGGGHPAAGTCQIQNEEAEKVLKHLIRKFNDS